MFLDLSRRHVQFQRNLSTEEMFVDLSRRCLPQSPNRANLKNVPGPIRGSLRSLATDDAYRNNVRRPIGKSLQALIEPVNLKNVHGPITPLLAALTNLCPT